MDTQWTIMLYESTTGDKPVEKFIKSLEEKGQAKIHNAIDKVSQNCDNFRWRRLYEKLGYAQKRIT